jgi:hypothetical protein
MMFQIIEFLLLLLPPHEIGPITTLGHLAEGPCNMGESQHEPSVEIGESQESMKLSQCGQGWPVIDDLNLRWINMYPMLIKNVAQVLDPIHAKRTFFQVGIELVLSKSAQNLLNMLHVLLPHSYEDEDVIQIYYHKGVGEGSQYIIHQPHESGWCIC